MYNSSMSFFGTEFLDFYGAFAFDGDGFQLLRVKLNVLALADRGLFCDLVLRYLVAGLGMDLAIPDAVLRICSGFCLKSAQRNAFAIRAFSSALNYPPGMQRAAGTAWSEPMAAWLHFAAAALAPLPFGSNEPIIILFWCAALGVCLALAPVHLSGFGQPALAGLAVFVVAAYALVLHEQLSQHPWFVSKGRESGSLPTQSSGMSISAPTRSATNSRTVSLSLSTV
jgi:hypothetical protein